MTALCRSGNRIYRSSGKIFLQTFTNIQKETRRIRKHSGQIHIPTNSFMAAKGKPELCLRLTPGARLALASILLPRLFPHVLESMIGVFGVNLPAVLAYPGCSLVPTSAFRAVARSGINPGSGSAEGGQPSAGV